MLTLKKRKKKKNNKNSKKRLRQLPSRFTKNIRRSGGCFCCISVVHSKICLILGKYKRKWVDKSGLLWYSLRLKNVLSNLQLSFLFASKVEREEGWKKILVCRFTEEDTMKMVFMFVMVALALALVACGDLPYQGSVQFGQIDTSIQEDVVESDSDVSKVDTTKLACESDVDCADGRECFQPNCIQGYCEYRPRINCSACIPTAEAEEMETCYDGLDNDCDGVADKEDVDCEDACRPGSDFCDDGDPGTEDWCSTFTSTCHNVALPECMDDADCNGPAFYCEADVLRSAISFCSKEGFCKTKAGKYEECVHGCIDTGYYTAECHDPGVPQDCSIGSTIEVAVDYDLSFEGMLAKAGVAEFDPLIPSNTFSFEETGKRVFKIKLVQYEGAVDENQNVPSTDVLEMIAEAGLLPAKVEHLLALHSACPDFVMDYWLMAAASEYATPYGAHSPYLQLNAEDNVRMSLVRGADPLVTWWKDFLHVTVVPVD